MKKFYLSKDMRLENKTFIERYKKRHGSERYDFSKTQYESMRRPVTITCKLHGDFEGLPQQMLKKNFCKECKKDDSINKINNRLRELNSTFIVSKEGFIKSTKPAKFVCIKTGKESIKIPYQYLNGLKERSKNRAIKEKKTEKELELIKDKFISNQIPLTYKLEEKNLISLHCKKHNYIKKFKISKLKNSTNSLEYWCCKCKKEKEKEVEKELIFLKFKDKATKESEEICLNSAFLKKQIVTNIKCKKHNLFFNLSLKKILKSDLNNIANDSCPKCKMIKYYKKNILSFIKDNNDYELNEKCNINLERRSLELICKKHGKIEIQLNKINRLIRTNNNVICQKCEINNKSVQNLFPELLEEWDYNKNVVKPENWSFGRNEKVFWNCKRCKKPFSCNVTQKNNLMNGCPHCSLKRSSKIERIIYFFIDKIFDKVSNNQNHSYLIKNKKTKLSFDILVDSLNPKLVIEYDGEYFHKNKLNYDLKKTNKIKKLGFNCLRIREVPLQNIQDHDIPFIYLYYGNKEFNSNLKWLLEEIFNYIKKKYVLLDEQISKMNEIINIESILDIIPKDFFIYPILEESLNYKYPELNIYWDLEKNKITTDQIGYKSQDKYYWVCNNGHSYSRTIKTQIKLFESDEIYCKLCSYKDLFKDLFDDDEIIDLYRKEAKNNRIETEELVLSKVNFKVECSCQKCNEIIKDKISIIKKRKNKFGQIICFKCETYEETKRIISQMH